jgi:hypothetical protein
VHVENHGLLSGTDSVQSSINQALTLCWIQMQMDGDYTMVQHKCQGKMCFCRSINALIPCSFCDSKINIYIYWLSRLWIYHYFEYVDCNIWFLCLSVLLSSPLQWPYLENAIAKKSLSWLFLYELCSTTCKKGGGGVWFTCACGKNRYCMLIKYFDLYKKDHENVGINIGEF